MTSIKEALTEAKTRLAGASASANLDAEVLMQHCLGNNLGWLITRGDEPLGEEDSQRFNAYVERRQKGEPVAYITGYKEFWSLYLRVNEAVLIPRPETEHLVEHALKHIPESGAWQILDLATGSGAVAIAIAKERPRSRITATDISPISLRVAAENANGLGIHNTRFILSDWFAALNGQTFDLIVCNPPYVTDDDPCLGKSELKFEPVLALQAGQLGLDALSMIGAQAQTHLQRNGWLLVEHGCDQQQQVASIFKTNGFEDITCHLDYASKPRITECRAASRPK